MTRDKISDEPKRATVEDVSRRQANILIIRRAQCETESTTGTRVMPRLRVRAKENGRRHMLGPRSH